MTSTILIGNSDNKLSQQEWSQFCGAVAECVEAYAATVEFSGHSLGPAPWQNACWVFTETADPPRPGLRRVLAHLAEQFRQDSIALIAGNTEFIVPPAPEGSMREDAE